MANLVSPVVIVTVMGLFGVRLRCMKVTMTPI